jgi:hypothetical protein
LFVLKMRHLLVFLAGGETLDDALCPTTKFVLACHFPVVGGCRVQIGQLKTIGLDHELGRERSAIVPRSTSTHYSAIASRSASTYYSAIAPSPSAAAAGKQQHQGRRKKEAGH